MTNAKGAGKARTTATTTRPTAVRKAKATAPAAVAPAKTAARAAADAAPNRAAESAGAAVATPRKPKPKLVRDSFTIPKSEYAVLEGLKLRAAKLARPIKKSELLRAGIAALSAMSDKAFLAALNGVPSLKTGRPKGAAATST
jgi:hypothetical protein